MPGLFEFSILDIWNRPEIQLLRAGTKMAVKGATTAYAKEQSKGTATAEFVELMTNAKNGDADAQCELALYYAEKHDFNEASHWLIKSAEQGHQHALEILDLLQGE